MNYNGKNLILKICRENGSFLSPFWKSMNMLFNHSFDEFLKQAGDLYKNLSNDYIKIAEPLYFDLTNKCHIYDEVPGIKYMPDVFPENENIMTQLGRYLGFTHKKEFENYGTIKNRSGKNFSEKLFQTIDMLINDYWNDSADVKIYRKKLTGTGIPAESFSPIMPDISANQFVFSGGMNMINGLVDLDAYVIGPKEFELTVMELCIPNGKCAEYFRRGYEEHGRLPMLEKSRPVYRFLVYLCDPENGGDIKKFAENETYFG